MSDCARILSGELHYPRIPRPYWRRRLQMARAMGLNAISTYVFWNRHELQPGLYDFSEDNDVAAFVRLAQEEDLRVILRPGPYVCAEWDFGGLPAWLLRDGPARVRTSDPAFMNPARRWLHRLGEELAPLQSSRGGPIFAVQLENEYGAFGSDKAYLRALHAALIEAGFGESQFFTIDQPGDLAAGSLDELPVAVTFAPGNLEAAVKHVRALRSSAPVLVGEYWAGWFDRWGEFRARIDGAQQLRDLTAMLSLGASVNVYMFHGGTNFGFWNGANADDTHAYQPTTTSYDYEAALDECGRPTEKYFAFREAIVRTAQVSPPDVPAIPSAIEVEEFALESCSPLDAAVVEATARGLCVESDAPLTMEALGQSFGYVLYRTRLQGPFEGSIAFDALRDFAAVSVNGEIAGYVDRRGGVRPVAVRCRRKHAVLDILVENCGRINYGRGLLSERKGIEGEVRLNGVALRGWEIVPLQMDDPRALPFQPGTHTGPAFYRGRFTVREPGDTFFDVSGLGKGVLWVNGRNAGRFWKIGPQYRLYVPGVWLNAGDNEAILFDIYPVERTPRLRGVMPRAH